MTNVFNDAVTEVESNPTAYDAARMIHQSLWHGVQALLENDDWQSAIDRARAMRRLEREFNLFEGDNT